MDIDKLIQDAVKKIMTDGTETQASAGRYDASYAKYMDHTVLKPETTRETVKRCSCTWKQRSRNRLALQKSSQSVSARSRRHSPVITLRRNSRNPSSVEGKRAASMSRRAFMTMLRALSP